jgi:hypothetical protein
MPGTKKWRYTSLPLSAEPPQEQKPLPQAKSNRRQLTYRILIVFLSCTAIAAILAAALSFSQLSTSKVGVAPGERLSCGNTIEEALARGCTFDILSMSWLRDSCPRDQADEFVLYPGAEPWRYFRHENATGEMDEAALSELGAGLWWAKQKEHMAHCAFMLLRLHAVLERGERPDGLTGSLKHSKHCVMMLLEASKWDPENDIINTPETVAFGVC